MSYQPVHRDCSEAAWWGWVQGRGTEGGEGVWGVGWCLCVGGAYLYWLVHEVVCGLYE